MKAVSLLLCTLIIATVVQSQSFTPSVTFPPTTATGQVFSLVFSGITGFYFNFFVYMPLNYGTFYYSGVGPYHEYDMYLNQVPIPLYGDLTSSMHFEEYGFDVQAAVKASFQMGFGGSSAQAAPYYTLAFNAELDAIKLVPYKQIFFFTRPIDIGEPAGQGPNLGPGGAGDDSGSDDSVSGSVDDSIDDSLGGSLDDSWGDDSVGDDSFGDDGDDSLDESARLQQDDSLGGDDSWDTSVGDDSLGDDSWDTSIDGSLADDSVSGSVDDSLSGSEAGTEGEAQGFHMFVGGAYDLEVGKVFVSYCEGAYTGTASIWTIGTSYWAGVPAAYGSVQMQDDCWVDPELVIELNDMLPAGIRKMLGQVAIYEVKLF
jgi:hypothetical protein